MDKVCNVCNEIKRIDNFVKDKNKKDGYRNICKKCNNKKRRKTPVKPLAKEGYKYCTKCNEELLLCEFNKRNISNDVKYFSWCKKCECDYNNNRYNHECKMCGKNYKSGKKDSNICKECHTKTIAKNGSKRFTGLNQSGQNNPMYGIRRFGIKNPNYNLNKTDEERENGRGITGYSDWRKGVYERDNYTCQCCGKKGNGDIIAHHLDGYNWFIEGRTDINNGITLCEHCHKEFHNAYGCGNNTKEQYKEFLNK